jgi:hypothetical protein
MVLEPMSSTLITETDSEMETIPKPCSAQPDVPVYKQKLTPAIQTPFPIDNTPKAKQCIIHDFYGPNSWYNTPATTHNFQSLTTTVKIHTGLVNRVSHAHVWEHVWNPVIWGHPREPSNSAYRVTYLYVLPYLSLYVLSYLRKHDYKYRIDYSIGMKE